MQVLETLHLCTNTDTGHSASSADAEEAHQRLLAGRDRPDAAFPAGAGARAPGRAAARRPRRPAHGSATTFRWAASRTSSASIPPDWAAATPNSSGCSRPSRSAWSSSSGSCTAAARPSPRPRRRWRRPCRCSTGRPRPSRSSRSSPAPRNAPRALLARFGNWAMGAVPQAQRRASVVHEGSDVGPVDWLLARGLLVPLDAAHVELPHSVGVSLRGGFVIENFALTPPVPRLGSTSAALRRNAALGAIAETLRLVGELLYTVREQPLVTLRSGGVGVREMKRLADSLRIELHDAGVLAELCALAGLLRLDVDSSAWVQPPQLEWLTPAAPGAVALAGQRLARQRARPVARGAARQRRRPRRRPRTGAPAGTTINALSAEAQRPDAPVVRKRILEILNELTREAAAPDGQAPVLDAAAVLERADWSQPRMARRFSSLIRGVLAEAEMLGLIGSGALSQIGAAIAAEQPDEALGILGEHLPAALNHVLLQADLTAVAPGLPRPGTEREAPDHGRRRGPGAGHHLPFLRLVDPPGARRRTGRPGPAGLPAPAFGHRHPAAAQLPDRGHRRPACQAPGRRRGQLHPERRRNGAAGTAQHRRRVRAGPGPHRAHRARSPPPRPGKPPSCSGAWACPRPSRTPSPPWSGCAAAPPRPAARARCTPRRGPPRRRPTSTRSWRSCAAGGRQPTAPGGASPPAPGSEEATQLGLETLQKAIRLKQRVVMNVVDSHGECQSAKQLFR